MRLGDLQPDIVEQKDLGVPTSSFLLRQLRPHTDNCSTTATTWGGEILARASTVRVGRFRLWGWHLFFSVVATCPWSMNYKTHWLIWNDPVPRPTSWAEVRREHLCCFWEVWHCLDVQYWTSTLGLLERSRTGGRLTYLVGTQ